MISVQLIFLLYSSRPLFSTCQIYFSWFSSMTCFIHLLLSLARWVSILFLLYLKHRSYHWYICFRLIFLSCFIFLIVPNHSILCLSLSLTNSFNFSRRSVFVLYITAFKAQIEHLLGVFYYDFTDWEMTTFLPYYCWEFLGILRESKEQIISIRDKRNKL